MQFVRVPRERIAILIGHTGDIKRRVKRATGGVLLEIDSETGEVNLDPAKSEDPTMVLKAADFVKAVGRGFSPERAEKLFNEDYYFQLLDIRDYCGKSPKKVRRLRSRIIGTDGKTRRIIEDMSGCELSIYGNTVGIIGSIDEMPAASTAVDMILSGSEHSTVYKFLEARRRRMKRSRWQL